MGKTLAMMEAKSIAVVGASPAAGNIGAQVVASLLSSGYQGQIFPIHPRAEQVMGRQAYPTLSSVGRPIDVAVIALNPRHTVETIRECGVVGIPAAVCVAGGFRELGEEGRELENRLIQYARQYSIEIIGPNTLGFINLQRNINATFFPLPLETGYVSFVSQSGGVGYSFLVQCIEERIGIAKWIGVGNRSTLEFSDYLRFLAEDDSTRVIGIFLEGSEKARDLVRTAGSIVAEKPVVVLKVGESKAAQYAALTHTGSMAGSSKMYSDVFRQHGILEANSLVDLVAACKALSVAPVPGGPKLGIVTITSGPSIVALDKIANRGAVIEAFPDAVIARIKSVLGAEPAVVLKNPLDTAGAGFQAESFGKIVDLILESPTVDVLLIIHCHHKTWRLPTRELMHAFDRHRKPIVACYIGTRESVAHDMVALQRKGIPVYTGIEQAVCGVLSLLDYRLSLMKARSWSGSGGR